MQTFSTPGIGPECYLSPKIFVSLFATTLRNVNTKTEESLMGKFSKTWCHPHIVEWGRPRVFHIDFKRRKLIKIQIKGGSWTIFLVSRISFFNLVAYYFCLASKIKIEIIEARHQTFFLIVWLEFPRLNILKDFKRPWRSLKFFKSWKYLKIFIESFKDFEKFFLLHYWDRQTKGL